MAQSSPSWLEIRALAVNVRFHQQQTFAAHWTNDRCADKTVVAPFKPNSRCARFMTAAKNSMCEFRSFSAGANGYVWVPESGPLILHGQSVNSAARSLSEGPMIGVVALRALLRFPLSLFHYLFFEGLDWGSPCETFSGRSVQAGTYCLHIEV